MKTDSVIRRRRVGVKARCRQHSPMPAGSIYFVAQDSRGQCFLWAVRWDDAGYACRSARLTNLESETLYKLFDQRNAIRPHSTFEGFGGSDPVPRKGSFIREENAYQFFIVDRDSDLRRWADVMFRAIREAPPP